MSRRAQTVALLAGVLAALLAGAAMGARLGIAASQPQTRDVRMPDPTSMPALAVGGARSAGGFTGFGGSPSLQGDVLRTGRVSTVVDGELVVSGDGGMVTVDYTQPRRLYRLGPAGRAVRVGDAVVVNVEGDRVTGVLLVNPGDASNGTQ